MKSVYGFTFILIFKFSQTFSQLNYVPPILCENRDSLKLNGVILLTTADYHTQLGASNHYPSTLQIIDPNNPWPPIFFTNAESGGNGILGKGYYNNFFFQEATGQFTFYMEIPGSGSPSGLFVICDSNLTLVDNMANAKNNIDSHDFKINSNGERLYMVVFDTLLNLVPFSEDPSDTAVLVTSQRIEIADQKGNIVFNWNPFDYFSINETYRRFHDLTENNPFTNGWDWQHGNSASFASDGNIIYSFRFLGLGKINRNTGEVMWKLGGKKPTIHVPEGGEYSRQHDFHEISPDVYSVFSNGDKKHPCKAIVYYINEKESSAKVVRVYEPDSAVYSISLGNYETEKNGLCMFNYGKYYTLRERQKMFEIIDTSGKVHTTFSSPSLNFAYRIQYMDSWKPKQPIITNTWGILKVSGSAYSVMWYLIDGTSLNFLSDNISYKPMTYGNYVATSRTAFGWYVTPPFFFSGYENSKSLPSEAISVEEKRFSSFLDSLNQLNITSFDKVNEIRSYVARILDLGQTRDSIAFNYSQIPWQKFSAFKCLELFQQNKLTAKCGLASYILAKLYDYAGYKCFIYTCGFDTISRSHQFNLVNLDGKLVVEDAFNNMTVIDQHGSAKDLIHLIDEVKAGNFSDIKILQQNTITEVWIDSLSQLFSSGLYNNDDFRSAIIRTDTINDRLKILMKRNYYLLSNSVLERIEPALKMEDLPDNFLSIYLKPLYVISASTGENADKVNAAISKVLTK